MRNPSIKAQHCLPTAQGEIEQDSRSVECPDAMNSWATERPSRTEQPVAMRMEVIKEAVRGVEEHLQVVIGESVVTSFQRVVEYDPSQPATMFDKTLGMQVCTVNF